MGNTGVAPVDVAAFCNGLRVTLKPLSTNGTSGIIYKCMYQNRPFVLKLSKVLVQARLNVINEQGQLMYAINMSKYKEWRDERQDFDLEFHYAERLFDPPTQLQHQRATRLPVGAFAGRESVQAQAEIAEMRRHPGYDALMSVWHYEPAIPCMLIHAYAGDIKRLYKDGGLAQPALRSRFYADMMNAVHYMRHKAALAHTDLKPDNILYKMDANGQISKFVIGDFGGCNQWDEAWTVRHAHTPIFAPYESKHAVITREWGLTGIPCYEMSLYSLAMLMMIVADTNICRYEYTYFFGGRPGMVEPSAKHYLDPQFFPSLHERYGHGGFEADIINMMLQGPHRVHANYAQLQHKLGYASPPIPASWGAAPAAPAAPAAAPAAAAPQPQVRRAITPEEGLLISDELGVLYTNMMRFDPHFAHSREAGLIRALLDYCIQNFEHGEPMQPSPQATGVVGDYYSNMTLAAISRLQKIMVAKLDGGVVVVHQGLLALRVYYEHLKARHLRQVAV